MLRWIVEQAGAEALRVVNRGGLTPCFCCAVRLMLVVLVLLVLVLLVLLVLLLVRGTCCPLYLPCLLCVPAALVLLPPATSVPTQTSAADPYYRRTTSCGAGRCPCCAGSSRSSGRYVAVWSDACLCRPTVCAVHTDCVYCPLGLPRRHRRARLHGAVLCLPVSGGK